MATPIGNPGDITLRALQTLRDCEIVIGEERKEVSKLLKAAEIFDKEIYLLNEHSKDADVADLLNLCQNRNVALVSDCGTPGFCDPGARLVAACRAAGVPITSVPGASSLMCLLSLGGYRLDQFLFRGFLPAEKESRAAAIDELSRERRPVILMDTPYRLEKLLGELAARYPQRKALLGLDFTTAAEEIHEADLVTLAQKIAGRKAEFMLLLYPNASTAAPTDAVKKSIHASKTTSPSFRRAFPKRRR